MAKEHTRRCSTSSVIREVQITATVRYYLTFTSMAVIKKEERMSRQGGEKGDPFYIAGGDV